MNFKTKLRWFDLIIIGITACCVLFVVLFGISWLLYKLATLKCI